MKTEMHALELVAIEDAALETVAGGYDYGKKFKLDLDLDFDFEFQKNEANVVANTIVAGRDAVVAITQSNA